MSQTTSVVSTTLVQLSGTVCHPVYIMSLTLIIAQECTFVLHILTTVVQGSWTSHTAMPCRFHFEFELQHWWHFQ